jgi:hypothetical protein
MTAARRVALGLFALGSVARAAEPEVAELNYDRGRLEECPDEAPFRSAVVERLGRDPFVAGAPRRITVRFERSGAALRALVRVEQPGKTPGERVIQTQAGCAGLANGAALAVSIAIDPLVALGPSPAPSEVVEPSPPPARKPAATPAPVTRPPAAPARHEPELGGFVRLGAGAFLGLVPGLDTGASVGFGVRLRHFSVALDGVGVPPRSAHEVGSPRAVSVGFVGVEAAPCLHLARARGCLGFETGALLAHGEGVDLPQSGSRVQANLGGGVGYSLVAGSFAFTPSVSGWARLHTSELTLNDRPIWTTPEVFGSLRLEVAYGFGRAHD